MSDAGMAAVDRAAWVATYNEINHSFEETLVFRIGAEAGFFSEFNHMVLAVAYCLKHHIRFVLNSNYANFAIEEGWNDYFLPFCEESVRPFNRRCNFRPYQLGLRDRRAGEIWFRLRARALARLWKLRHPAAYLTQDVFARLRSEDFSRERFDVPRLGLEHASLLDTTRTLIAHLWHYTPRLAADVDRVRASIALPERYISFHIRHGDKRTESRLFDTAEFMAAARRLAPEVTDVFVASDDYTNVEKLRADYPAYEFSTFTRPEHRGYDQAAFDRVAPASRYEELVTLFATVDVCAGSQVFIGTNSSNVGMYMGMRIGMGRCHFLDGEQWRVW